MHFPCTAFSYNGTNLSADYKTGIEGTGEESQKA